MRRCPRPRRIRNGSKLHLRKGLEFGVYRVGMEALRADTDENGTQMHADASQRRLPQINLQSLVFLLRAFAFLRAFVALFS